MAGPLRIVQVLRTPVGGLFRHVIDLSGELARRGHQLAVVVDSLTGDAVSEKKLAGLAPFARLGIHRLPIHRLFGAGDLVAPLRIRRLAREIDAHILHGHGAKGGFHARLAGIGSRRRAALYTPHGGVLHFPPASFAGRTFRTLERLLASHTDAMVFESAFAREAYSSQIGAPACPAPVIHNGLAPEEFTPVHLEARAADFAFIGELRELKGIFVLVEALAGVSRPDGRPASLILAGDGPDRDRLASRVAELGLADRVLLAGVLPARSLFARGHTVVVPSLAESLPYVVLEAAAAGRPIIATRVGGIPEIFGPTSDGLVEAGSAEALRAAMERSLAHPEGAEKNASLRFAHVASRFSVARMTDEIEALYVKLAG